MTIDGMSIKDLVAPRQQGGGERIKGFNRTNARNLVKVYGDDEATWPGKKIVLSTEPVSFRGETTNIRMQAAAPARRKKEAEQVAEVLEDEVPF